MGRFDQKYSAEQKAAVVSAQVDRAMTATEAVRYAAEGKLEGLDPFEIGRRYAGFLASDERKKRRGDDLSSKGRGTPVEQLENSSARLLSVFTLYVEQAQGRAKKARRAGRGGDEKELDRLRRLATFGREVGALVKGVPTAGGGKSPATRAAAAEKASASHAEASQPSEETVRAMLADNDLETPKGRRGNPTGANGTEAREELP